MDFAATRRVGRVIGQLVPLTRGRGGAHLRAFAAASGAAPTSDMGATAIVEANGHRFFVVSSGAASSEPVLCMPGAMGTAETDFPYQLKGSMSAKYNVISMDPRGYGKSRPPVRDWPADFYQRDAADAHAVMEKLGFKAYSVIGWSDGANSAVILADKHPDVVKKLVILGGNAWVEQADIDSYEATRDVKKNWSKRMLDLHVPVYGDDLQPMWDGFCDAMKAIMARGGHINMEEAKRIRCPTFVLAGAKDPIVPLFHAKWYHENIPGAKLHVFPEGKHNIHIKYGDEFNELVMNFLAE